MELVTRRELLARRLFKTSTAVSTRRFLESQDEALAGDSPGDHVDAAPGRLPINLELAAVLVRKGSDVTSREVLDQAGKELLGSARDYNLVRTLP